jgi:hypothetical protein
MEKEVCITFYYNLENTLIIVYNKLFLLIIH